jgi:hypothetical protein
MRKNQADPEEVNSPFAHLPIAEVKKKLNSSSSPRERARLSEELALRFFLAQRGLLLDSDCRTKR